MALRYVEKLQGYIADVPDIDFTRCDGRLFHFDQVNTAGVNNTAEQLTINGGQGNFPLAIIDTNKNVEMTFSSSQFTMEMFEMAHATNATQKDVGITESKRFAVETGQTVTLPYEVQAGSVKITGMEEAETASAGKYSVKITAATEDKGGSTVVTFAEDDAVVGDIVRIGFTRRAVNAHVVSVKTTSTTARGGVIYHYPVYSSGTDCTESAVKGMLHAKVHRVRVTALPGFDTSYKTAATNSVTFTAMDPQRPDKGLVDYIYEEYGEDGSIVATSAVATDDVAWN